MSQYLFEETFNLRFKDNFSQLAAAETHSGAAQVKLEAGLLDRVRSLNKLDIEVYSFANRLMAARFKTMGESDSHYSEHMARLGREKYQFSWRDIEGEEEVEGEEQTVSPS